MATVNIYLNFKGNCEEAFNHYKSVFGGEFAYVGRFGEMPEGEGGPVSDDMKNQIMHMSLPISRETILMGCDVPDLWAPEYKQGNNFSISVTADSKEQADQIFNKLSEGGKASMPMAKTFWSEYFGMLTDKFGINWMVSIEDMTV